MKTNLKRSDFVMVRHLQHAWEQALRERLDPQLMVSREERVFSLVCSCDATPSGRYLSWLSRWRRQAWEDIGLRAFCDIEDLGELSEALRHFESIRKHLPAGHNDVNAYMSARELMEASRHVNGSGKRALRDAERQEAMAGSDVLFDEERWKLVRLRSKEAAKWWGKGTRWCTAARYDNRYELYAHSGDLLVLLTPLDRYQLSCGSGEFRNSVDAPAHLGRVLSSAPEGLKALVEQRSKWRHSA